MIVVGLVGGRLQGMNRKSAERVWDLKLPGLGISILRASARGFGADRVDCLAGCHPVKPGGKGAGDGTGLFEELKERLLGGVGGRVGVGEDADARSIDKINVSMHDL